MIGTELEMLTDIVSPVACFFSWFCQLTVQLTVSTFSTSLRSRADAAATVHPPLRLAPGLGHPEISDCPV
jgi:hypothetical protein